MQKKGFFYKHPILAGLIVLVAAFFGVNLIAAIPIVLFGSAMSEAAKMDCFNLTVIAFAVLAMVLMRVLNRKRGYQGVLKVRSRNLRDVWICIAVFSAVILVSILSTVLTLPNGLAGLPVPTFSILLMAVYAGINEEIFDRALPLSLMLRNSPDSRRIRLAVLLSSIFFGIGHMINAIGEADIFPTIIQCIFAVMMGVFFAAIYLRTGSILLTIVIHMLYDIIALVLGGLGVDSVLLNTLSLVRYILPFVLGLIMLRKKHHADIIETWSRIWPEA